MGGRELNDRKKGKLILENLLQSVKECQNVYGKTKTLLATEKDIRIQNLCVCWECALSHGLRTVSLFQHIVSGNLTTESTSMTFWDFAYQHLTGHEKERFSTLRYVYTEQGKVRALIRSALNERALERYILTWLSDANGLAQRYESWALVRDNEAANLLPSIAAGLGSILFAVTVDSSELNVVAPVEMKQLQKQNEIIIAVPVVGQCNDAKLSPKSTASKRKPIISFEDDEMESTSSHSSNSIKSPIVSLSDACLKYGEKEKQRIESIQAICNDSSYERMRTAHCIDNDIEATIESEYVEFIEPESPTKIRIFTPVLSTPTYSSYIDTNGLNESHISTSTRVDSSAESNTPSTSTSSSASSPSTSSSVAAVGSQQASTHPSLSESIASSISSVSQSGHFVTASESESVTNTRLKELEQRCASLEEQITALTLENARLKSLHYNLVANRQTSRFFSISIPRVLLQHVNSPRRKKFFAYEIKIMPLNDVDGEKWSLLRRYSEFHRLHKYLQKDNVAIKAVDFPPKNYFGNMNAEFVEQRRQRLQVYLLSILSLMPEIARCTTRTQLEQAFPFFKQTHQIL